MLTVRSARLRSAALLLFVSTALAGCASLPASGPTAAQIKQGAKPKNNEIGFTIRDITPDALAQAEAARKAVSDGKPTLASLQVEGRNDVVGPGDVLAISIYEVGVGLFGGHGVADAQSFDPSARAENFQAITVDRDGTIALPYIGKLTVTGKSLPEIQTMIAAAYHRQSQNPQVVVALKNNVSETVFVSGEVRKPGRLELSLAKERLLDAIALSGGTTIAPEDTVIRLSRGNQVVEERFDIVRTSMPDDLQLVPGDRIEIVKKPRSFLVLGATSKVSQVPFETSEVSLAEAIARGGGPNDTMANASGIFVFRYEPSKQGGMPEVPVIYRINMLKPESYFLAQSFFIQDKDVVYVSNSPANAVLKFVSILNQLFSPAVAISYAVR